MLTIVCVQKIESLDGEKLGQEADAQSGDEESEESDDGVLEIHE